MAVQYKVLTFIAHVLNFMIEHSTFSLTEECLIYKSIENLYDVIPPLYKIEATND